MSQVPAECIPSVLCAGNESSHQISCVQEVCLKCHLSYVLIFSFMPHNVVIENVPEMSCILTTGNVPEMSCVLARGNMPEILPYIIPGNIKEMSKFPGVRNDHTMNRKCELSCTFHGISWPRISSSLYPLHSVNALLRLKYSYLQLLCTFN